MKQSVFFIALCLLYNPVFAQDELQKTFPEGCHCSVMLPGAPKKSISTDSTGNTHATISFWNIYGGNKLYALEMCVYDEGYNFDDTKELLAQRDNFCASTKTEMLNTTIIKQNGFAGIDFISKGTTNTFYNRILIVEKRVYILFVALPTDAIKTSDVDRFLDSFNTMR